MADDDTSEFEWDPSRSVKTAWSAVARQQPKRTRGRRARAYGKAAARGRESRRCSSTHQDSDNNTNPTDLSWLRDFDLNPSTQTKPRVEKEKLRRSVSLDTVPLRPLHTRSFSVSAIPSTSLRRSLHTRSQSFANKALLSDWADTENVDPNSGRALLSSPSDKCRRLPRATMSPRSPEPNETTDPHEEPDLRLPPRKTRKLATSFSEIAKGGETWPGAIQQPPTVPCLWKSPGDSKAEQFVRTGSLSACANGEGSASRKRTSDSSDDRSTSAQAHCSITIFSPQLTISSTFSPDSNHPFIFDDEEEKCSELQLPDRAQRNRAKSFDTATDDDDSIGERNISMIRSFDSTDHIGDDSFLPPLHRASSAKFEASLFGPSAPAKQLSKDLIIETMPCFADVRHLIKELNKEKKAATHCTWSSPNNWTVHAKTMWAPERRVSFLQWANHRLGFSVRSAGGTVVFLQISRSKGEEVLSSLITAYKYYIKLPCNNGRPGGCPIPMELSVRKPMQTSPIIDATLGENVRPRRLVGLGRNKREHDRSIDAELLHTMKAMCLSPTEPTASDSNPKTATNKVVQNATVDPVLEGSASSFEGLGDFPLKPSRFSDEHQIGGQDLVSSLHGLSPMAPTRRSRFSHRSDLGLRIQTTAPSPMIPAPLSSTRSGRKERLSFGLECLETPQVKQTPFWEGRSGGRDWGAHPGCSMEITDHLLQLFEERYDEECEDLVPVCSQTSCFLDSEFAAAASPEEDPFEVDERIEEEEEEDDGFSTSDEDIEMLLPPPRRSSVGATAFSSLHLDDKGTFILEPSSQALQRRKRSMAKHRRVSLVVQASDTRRSLQASRLPSFAGTMSRKSSILHSRLPAFHDGATFGVKEELPVNEQEAVQLLQDPFSNPSILGHVFTFLDEGDLLLRTSPVCTLWADASTEAHATLVLSSVGCCASVKREDESMDDNLDENETTGYSIMKSMEKPWNYLLKTFPWACFLSEGAFKRVYKVYNRTTQTYEALSVMDVDEIEYLGNVHVVGTELAVSAMLASLVRRNVCPNFVVTRRVFTSPFEPPSSHWGCSKNKRPNGAFYDTTKRVWKKPRQPTKDKAGRYQYMRMELCEEGDAEEYLKRLPEEIMTIDAARNMLFQMAFALYAAADRYSLKHYDVKLLNFFLRRVDNTTNKETVVLRYGLGSLNFALEMPTDTGLIVKLADYGTANVQPETNGQPVTIGQFTTMENTPPDFMILGDAATQGHGHDAFGLGLCMLHLFTGHRPYEEILDDVKCPPALRKKLSSIYLEDSGYDVIRSVMLAEVEVDEDEAIVDGELDEVLLDTLYKYLVLFGIPENKYQLKEHGQVWRAITSCLESSKGKMKGYGTKRRAARQGPDQNTFEHDQKRYSLLMGNNKYIARARTRLQSMDGGLELLQALTHFDPSKRASMSDVLNSSFMESLREQSDTQYSETCHVMSFLSYATA